MDVLLNLLVLAPVTAARSSTDEAALIPLVLCLSGFIYFGIMYARYRNADKRHSHEAETSSQALDVKGYDQLIEHRKRLRNAQMHGANDSQIEGALNTSDNALEKMSRKFM